MADERTTDIVRRLKSVEGHVRGVQRMVEEGTYCIDIVNQIVAVQRALKKVSGRDLGDDVNKWREWAADPDGSTAEWTIAEGFRQLF